MTPKNVRAGVFAALLLAGSATAQPLQDGATAFAAGDFAAALALWQPLADSGDAVAQFNLGILYDQGDGVTEDRAEAIRWYQAAAEQGDARAAFNLGLIYEAGDGVAQDMPQAVEWYRQAGEGGDVLAQFKLGLIYTEGRGGIPQDDAEAVIWYELAAEQNHADAQYNLGTMYANGRGVERNLSTANAWYERADVAMMSGGSATACTPTSAARLEECRRVVPRS
jgi:TPR repeat protein